MNNKNNDMKTQLELVQENAELKEALQNAFDAMLKQYNSDSEKLNYTDLRDAEYALHKANTAPTQLPARGAASLLLSMKNGQLTATHGTDGSLLHQRKINDGEWDSLCNWMRGNK